MLKTNKPDMSLASFLGVVRKLVAPTPKIFHVKFRNRARSTSIELSVNLRIPIMSGIAVIAVSCERRCCLMRIYLLTRMHPLESLIDMPI